VSETRHAGVARVPHASYSGVPRLTHLEKALFACDELAGFLTACALVKPTKSISDVEVAGVCKKMKDKAFAKGVHREDIVNGAAELTRGQKVSFVFGPVNSGESLAVVPLLARTNTPQVHPCWVDTLTDPKKYPMCFRNAPTNQQIGAAANRYVVETLKRKKVAVISDTTGYGTASANAYAPMLKARGAEVVYQGNIDAANPDLKPELLRMQSAGAEAIMPWSVNAGFLSRIINTRGQMAWDVPIVGQTTLGSGQTKALLEKPEYWAKVYPNNFRPVCYAPGGKLSDRTSAFLDRLKSAKIDMGDTLLWWIALGYDTPRMIGEAMKSVGTEPAAVVGYLNKLKGFPGVYGDISFAPNRHDGYPDDEVVMVEANSLKDGAFNLAPGYSA